MPLNKYSPTDKLTLGFPSGRYKDGSTLFPGTGSSTMTFFGQSEVMRVPARISTDKIYKGAYGYSENFYDGYEAKFYLDHPNIRWLNISLKQVINNAVPG